MSRRKPSPDAEQKDAKIAKEDEGLGGQRSPFQRKDAKAQRCKEYGELNSDLGGERRTPECGNVSDFEQKHAKSAKEEEGLAVRECTRRISSGAARQADEIGFANSFFRSGGARYTFD
jgi:hypothetical protein